MTAVALRCQGLVKRYEDVVAVDGLDLEVRAGECFGLLGPNGAGKTTTIEILEGLNDPDGGVVEVLGERWTHKNERSLRERLGVALQETQLTDILTVAETLRLFRSFYRRGRTVDEVIQWVELGEKRDARVGKLSGGQRQRVALACALVGAPDVLFLDEPTTGLDPQSRRKIWDIVHEFRKGGGTLLLSTHYMEEAERLCDRVAVVDHGKIIALGTPAQLIQSLGADQVIEVQGQSALEPGWFQSLPAVRNVAIHGQHATLRVDDIARAMPPGLAALQEHHAPLESLATRHATLDDVFVHLTGRALRDG